ncbi:NAD(P)H-dependent FMN reductase [Dyella jiangningensis]|jgi:chromate reductase|uniref:NADPH-dependent FMN reductase n=2 Tax=Gammaproteobacteria TaxID=1236 RepID=UPI000887593B|nr:NADPH-dependent FMN reductase [Dyella sp. AtDHG13]PXV61373.1 chromate reductase [Dyella sp. AtDHG13]SDJ92442.1 NAD(P)H-dependent FMN reductase [Dyella jiangningensis]
MNVLGISGSLRQASFNTALLHAAQELAPAGMNIIIHRLHDLPLFNQDVEEQGDPAPVVEFKQAIERADGLLFACPEYNGGITGVLKNAVDWASRAGKAGKVAALTGKTICIVGASPGITGTVRAQDQLRLVLRRAGARTEPQGDVLVFQAHTKIIDGRLADDRTREALGRHLQSFAERLAASIKDF